MKNAPTAVGALNLYRLAGHLAASLDATTTSLGAALAVIHVVRTTLFGAPIADIRAQLADLLGEWTVAGDSVRAQAADRRALDAAGRAVIYAFLADHVREAVAALGSAVVAGGNTVYGVLVKRVIHDTCPYLW